MEPVIPKPGTRSVNHNAPKHRCPVCNHVCHLSKPPKERSNILGRPATGRQKLIDFLARYPDERHPATAEQIAEACNVVLGNVYVYISRARHQGGVDIRLSPYGGYYLPTLE